MGQPATLVYRAHLGRLDRAATPEHPVKLAPLVTLVKLVQQDLLGLLDAS